MSQIIIQVPPFLEIIVAGVTAGVSWLFGRVVFRYMLLPWLGKKIAEWLGRKLKPTEREAIIIRHYIARQRGKIHQSTFPWGCSDGKCPKLRTTTSGSTSGTPAP